MKGVENTDQQLTNVMTGLLCLVKYGTQYVLAF